MGGWLNPQMVLLAVILSGNVRRKNLSDGHHNAKWCFGNTDLRFPMSGGLLIHRPLTWPYLKNSPSFLSTTEKKKHRFCTEISDCSLNMANVWYPFHFYPILSYWHCSLQHSIKKLEWLENWKWLITSITWHVYFYPIKKRITNPRLHPLQEARHQKLQRQGPLTAHFTSMSPHPWRKYMETIGNI